MTQPDPLIEFAAALRAVRAAAGDVPSADVAARAGVEEPVLAAALSGGMLPSLAVTLAIVRAYGATTEGWEDKWREVATAHLGGAASTPAPPAAAPPSAPATPPRPNAAPSVGRPPAPNSPPSPGRPAQPASAPPAAAPVPPPPPASPPPAQEAAPPAVPEPPRTEPPRTEADTPPAPPTAETTVAPVHQDPPPQPARVEATRPNPNLPETNGPAPSGGSAPDTVQPPVVERPPARSEAPPAPDRVADTTRGPGAAPGGPSWEGPDRAVLEPLEPDDPRTVGGYVLRARLGSGGMGRVYLSYTPGGRPVAIKVIRGEFAEDPEFRRRFRQEVTAAQRVQGLYTAPVIDTDADAQQPWLATAYVAGPSLYDAVYRHGPLPAETILILLAGVAEALQSVHSAGIVHRDLKPSNVILAGDGPRVIDFGIARAADATPLTRTGMSIGTPAFMAPEQARGLSAKPATDVFALGSLGVYAATGRSAFGEGTDSSVLYRVVHQDPDLSGCPEQILSVLRRCLEKDPDNRPTPAEVIELCRAASQSTRLQVGEGWLPPTLVDEVTRRVNEQPPSPPKDPAIARRRKRRALISAITVLVLAAAGGGLALGLSNKDKDDDKGKVANPDATRSQTSAPESTGGSAPTPPTTTAPTNTEDTESADPSASPSLPEIASRPGESATAIPAAGGVAEGGVLFERQLDVPDGYCVGLSYTSTWESCDVDAGVLAFSSSNNYVEGKEMVLLDPGQQADYATCVGETRFANDDRLPLTYLKVGSVICTKDLENGLVGTIRVNQIPVGSGPSTYWKVQMTVWRGNRS